MANNIKDGTKFKVIRDVMQHKTGDVFEYNEHLHDVKMLQYYLLQGYIKEHCELSANIGDTIVANNHSPLQEPQTDDSKTEEKTTKKK